MAFGDKVSTSASTLFLLCVFVCFYVVSGGDRAREDGHEMLARELVCTQDITEFICKHC